MIKICYNEIGYSNWIIITILNRNRRKLIRSDDVQLERHVTDYNASSYRNSSFILLFAQFSDSFPSGFRYIHSTTPRAKEKKFSRSIINEFHASIVPVILLPSTKKAFGFLLTIRCTRSRLVYFLYQIS